MRKLLKRINMQVTSSSGSIMTVGESHSQSESLKKSKMLKVTKGSHKKRQEPRPHHIEPFNHLCMVVKLCLRPVDRCIQYIYIDTANDMMSIQRVFISSPAV